MKIKTKIIKQALSDVCSKDTVDLDSFMNKVDQYVKTDARSDMISQNIKDLLSYSFIFSDKDLASRLIDDIGPDNYFKEMVPKIFFGRRYGHTTGICKFISENPELNVVVVTSQFVLAENFKNTLAQFDNTLTVPVLSLSKDIHHSNLRGVDLILVDEYPAPNSASYDNFLRLIYNSTKSGFPLITLGTMF